MKNAVQEKINLTSSGGSNERRTELRAQWDAIRQDQAKIKTSRQKTFDQLKAMQDNVAKKVNDSLL